MCPERIPLLGEAPPASSASCLSVPSLQPSGMELHGQAPKKLFRAVTCLQQIETEHLGLERPVPLRGKDIFTSDFNYKSQV